MSPPQPLPIVTLRLSHPNLLDAVLSCDGHPIYSFETAHNQTVLFRCIPDTDDLEEVASVQWPISSSQSSSRRKDKSSGVLVKMRNGFSQPESEFLKLHCGVLSTSRKFHIPGLDRSLKWRRAGSQGVYECTSPTTSTPVATFEPAILTSPAKIKIYTTDVVPPQRGFLQSKVNGVCTLLMDYIVLTTMLLVTDREDWRIMAATRSASASVASGSPTSSSPVSPISPVTPFSANQSPSTSSYDSWYRSAAAAGNGTFLSSNGSYCVPSSTGTCISIRSTASQQSRLRPRTSPSSSNLSSLAATSATSGHSMRRSASQYVRPGSQWQSRQATPSSSSVDEDEDFEQSDVLDIRPTHTRSQSYSPTPSPTQTPTRSLRVEVPAMVPATPTRTTAHNSAVPTATVYPHLTAQHLPFLKTDPSDMPPPYEEIEWTVRVKNPRRVRSTAGLGQ